MKAPSLILILPVLGLYAPAGSEVCLTCPPGKQCENITAGPVDCEDGYYSIGGKVSDETISCLCALEYFSIRPLIAMLPWLSRSFPVRYVHPVTSVRVKDRCQCRVRLVNTLSAPPTCLAIRVTLEVNAWTSRALPKAVWLASTVPRYMSLSLQGPHEPITHRLQS